LAADKRTLPIWMTCSVRHYTVITGGGGSDWLFMHVQSYISENAVTQM